MRNQSDAFEYIAKTIESDPEWRQKDEVDDDALVEACRIAADALRKIGK